MIYEWEKGGSKLRMQAGKWEWKWEGERAEWYDRSGDHETRTLAN
jgi:hypothetical protein